MLHYFILGWSLDVGFNLVINTVAIAKLRSWSGIFHKVLDDWIQLFCSNSSLQHMSICRKFSCMCLYVMCNDGCCWANNSSLHSCQPVMQMSCWISPSCAHRVVCGRQLWAFGLLSAPGWPRSGSSFVFIGTEGLFVQEGTNSMADLPMNKHKKSIIHTRMVG